MYIGIVLFFIFGCKRSDFDQIFIALIAER